MKRVPPISGLEPKVKLTQQKLAALGENFEKAGNGFIDFLLLDERGFPFIVLEAKAENQHPLVGKEQAREYAQAQKCRFVILSNGNFHYFWDLERGKPRLLFISPVTKAKLRAAGLKYGIGAMGARSCTFDDLLAVSQ